MNPDQPSREQIEARLTALLLGELPADEAALLRYTMAQDPALKKLHDELQSTLGLVREAVKTPADAPVEKSAALKLSAERRQKLLAHFKTQRPKPEPLFWLKRIKAPQFVAALAFVMLIGVIAAVLLPTWVPQRSFLARVSQTDVLSGDAAQELKSRTWAGDNRSREPMQATTVNPPHGEVEPMAKSGPTPQIVTVAPEPQLAPPPAAPPVQIVLPNSEPAQALTLGGELKGYDRIQLPSSTIAGLGGRGEAGGFGGGGTAGFGVTTYGATTTGVGGKTVLGSDVSADIGARFEQQKKLGESGNPGYGDTSFALSAPALPTLGLNDSGVTRSGGEITTEAQRHEAFANARIPAYPSATPPTRSSANISKEPEVENAGEIAVSTPARQPVGGAPAGNFYRTLAPQSAAKEVPVAGDIPVTGRVFDSSLAVATPPLPAETTPPQPGAGAGTTTFAFDSSGGRGENDKDLWQTDKSKMESLAHSDHVAGVITGNGPVVMRQGSATLGVASDSFQTGLARKDIGELRYIIVTNGLSVPGATPENQNFFAGRYAYVATNSFAGAPIDQTKQIQLAQGKVETSAHGVHVTDLASRAIGPTPTMDAQQLQAINQQRIDGEKSYSEQLVQLQELKTIAATDKGKLSGVLPLMVQDGTLNDLLAKRHEVQQKLVQLPGQSESPGKPASERARTQSLLDELSHEIDDRENGIMAGLESQVRAKKASLDALNASVDSAKRKDLEEAKSSQPYYDAKRELEQEMEMHKLLYAKLESEKLDLGLPKDSMVQITDPAEPPKSQTTWQRLTGQYAATARMKVENDVTDIPGMMSSGPSANGYDPYFIQTTTEIIKSDRVLGNVVQALDLQSAWAKNNGGEKLTSAQAVSQLKRRLDLQPVQNTKLIAISAKSSDPQEAADIANAVAKAYTNYRIESRRALTTNGVAVLEQQFQEQQFEIKTNNAYVEKLRKELGIVDEDPNGIAPAPVAPQLDVPIRRPSTNAPIPQPEILTSSNAFSTFSLNVSDVSFKFAEASLQNGRLPDTASIRSEEFINAFDYRDPEAAAGQPMAFMSERAHYPFAHNRELLRFSIKTAAAGRQAGRALNLVLLLDNSGSMERADRVGIVHEALHVLATQLQPQDTVSVVTFARTPRLWADGISGDKAGEALGQVGGITPEGGTNLEEAMRLAYETARRHYLAGGMNRVVLLTDGAANLGNVEPAALKEKVEAQRKQGIALDCFGIGWEDFNDDLLEQLSSNGDGRYAFLNSPEDASKEFAAKLAGALQVAAADVKVQVEFNPRRVISYRQIGYAKHQLTKEQFRDNTVDAAEIAAQEAGNALYTIETNPNGDGPVATVHVRYKVPGTSEYREHSWDVAYTGSAPAMEQASAAMRLASTAGAFSEWLAASPFAQEVTLDELLKDFSGVPEVYGADDRPKQLETMIREAKSLEGK